MKPMENKPEYITCAAIWYKDLPTQVYPPKNIDKGLVVCGHRHSNCIDIMKSLAGLRTTQFGPDSVGETIQGFMTSRHRFVDRQEAMSIAKSTGQVDLSINQLGNPMIGLFSEDLY
jgi:hypothetical protein